MINVGDFFKTYVVRHACSSMVAVVLAGVVSHLVSYSYTHWIVLAAFMMCQVSRGAPLRQSLIMIAIMVIALIFADMIHDQKQLMIELISLFAAYFVTGVVVVSKRPLSYRQLVTMTLFMVTFTIAMLQQGSLENTLPNQLIDLMIGSTIGMVCGVMILPIRVIEDFYDGLLEVLGLLKRYMEELADNYKNGTRPDAQYRLQALHKMMLAKSNVYPEWVYDVGFNRLLRSGFRYYLIVIDRIIELLNSIELLNNECADYAMINEYGFLLADVMDQNQKIVKVVMDYVALKQVSEIASDLVSDISAVEEALQSMIPASLELIELTPKFIKTTALVRDMRDLRDLLLKLVVALPINDDVKKKMVA